MAIRVEGPNPWAYRRLKHHAPGIVPIADALKDEILFGWIGQDDTVHTLWKSREGMGSFCLILDDGRTYYFRRHGNAAVIVYDKAQEPHNVVTILDDEVKPIRWIRSLNPYKNKRAAA
jgi:hypothetical protein